MKMSNVMFLDSRDLRRGENTSDLSINKIKVSHADFAKADVVIFNDIQSGNTIVLKNRYGFSGQVRAH